MRIQIPLVIEMTDQQMQDYARDNGLPKNGGRLYAREVVENVQRHVLYSVQELARFDGLAEVSIKSR